jgi:2-succinyl-5-enolpyruvyl-6-hydroxy-3-cyclohexene-1-carboxylate synthase
VDQGDISLTCAWALVDELARAGARHACLSPGSRSTSLALALARHPSIELHVHLDERSSGFFALGLAKATLRPVIVACTSGTAAAELWPSVVEASQSRMPLVLLTADRPPRLRGTGANQTIDQVELYGSYVRASFDLPPPTKEGHAAWWRQAARDAVEAASGEVVGPVHVNCPFEEPLAPTAAWEPPPTEGEEPERRERERMDLDVDRAERVAAHIDGARGVVVIGGWPGDVTGLAKSWAERLGWPVLAEPISNTRRQGWTRAGGQSVIGDADWMATHMPEVVIQFGATPTSRATQALVAASERLVVVDRFHPDTDPERHAWMRLQLDPDEFDQAVFGGRHVVQKSRKGDEAIAIAVAGDLATEETEEIWDRRIHPAPTEWTQSWIDADDAARAALDGYLDALDEPFEPRIARDVAAFVPQGGTLFVGNSTPIRDVDLAMAPRDGLRVLANRGASGIDGLVSTAFGIAAAGRGPTFALLGDLSLVHDAGSLLWHAPRRLAFVLVVVNNGGGQIFSLLPQRDLPEHRALFTTPHLLELGALCAAAGAGHERVEHGEDLVPALSRASRAGGVQVVEVIVDAELGAARRGELRDVVRAALRRAPSRERRH